MSIWRRFLRWLDGRARLQVFRERLTDELRALRMRPFANFPYRWEEGMRLRRAALRLDRLYRGQKPFGGGA